MEETPTIDKRKTSDQADLRKYRMLMRAVDYELQRYGPRRALNRLRGLKVKIPLSLAGPVADYMAVLTEMMERKNCEADDCEFDEQMYIDELVADAEI